MVIVVASAKTTFSNFIDYKALNYMIPIVHALL